MHRHVLGDAVRVVGKAVLEIRVEWNVVAAGKLTVVRQHVVHASRAVGIAFRMGATGAGRRQRLEAKALEIARAADIPGIGN